MTRYEIMNKAHEEWLKDNSAQAFTDMALRSYDAGVRAASPPPRGMTPLTVEKMQELYRMTQNAVNDLEAEDKYTFAAWFPIAVGFIEAAHGIGPSTQGVDHGG